VTTYVRVIGLRRPDQSIRVAARSDTIPSSSVNGQPFELSWGCRRWIMSRTTSVSGRVSSIAAILALHA
jgi:hypothetical protein